MSCLSSYLSIYLHIYLSIYVGLHGGLVTGRAEGRKRGQGQASQNMEKIVENCHHIQNYALTLQKHTFRIQIPDFFYHPLWFRQTLSIFLLFFSRGHK